MPRRGEFAAGLALGGLAGLVVGYLVSRNDQLEAEPPTGTIDLTPTMEAEERRAAAAGEERPARAKRAAPKPKETEE